MPFNLQYKKNLTIVNKTKLFYVFFSYYFNVQSKKKLMIMNKTNFFYVFYYFKTNSPIHKLNYKNRQGRWGRGAGLRGRRIRGEAVCTVIDG